MSTLWKIGVIGDKHINLNYLKDTMEDAHKVTIEGKDFFVGKYKIVQLILCNCFDDKDIELSVDVFKNNFNVHLVVGLAVGSSLSDEVKLCDMVFAHDVIDLRDIKDFEQGERVSYATDCMTRRIAIEAYNRIKMKSWSYHIGRIISTQEIIVSKEKRMSLFRESGACCIDSISAKIGFEASKKNLKYFFMCIIADAANHNSVVIRNEFSPIAAHCASSFFKKFLNEIFTKVISV